MTLHTKSATLASGLRLRYVEQGRQCVRDTIDGLTNERAGTPTPSMPWTPYARVLLGLVAHTNEHAAQILQHVNGVARRP